MKGSVLMLYLAMLAGCAGNQRQPGEIIRKVKIETVHQADSLMIRSLPGIIREAAEINLAFRVAGPIQKVYVKDGDYIKAGQLVAQIDPRDYEVQVEAARAQYDQVKAEAGRVTELHKRRSVTSNDYDKAVSGLKMVTAQLKNASDQLNDTRLLAPVSGYIQKINYRENELVDAGMPVASMIDVGHYLVEADIPAVLYVNRGSIVSVTGVQPDVSDQPFPLQLLSFSKKAGNNQLYRLLLRLNPALNPGLVPGMDMQVSIQYNTTAQPQVCVPLTALFSEDGKTYAWVYHSTGTVSKREVVAGKLTGDGRIRIIKGLQANEQVVVAGVALLHENQRVEPLETVPATNIGGLM
jgi:RND family efflux transporter MFP subunit